ncbi:hypothetical protein Tco_1168447 [Tanacetum coccineum]
MLTMIHTTRSLRTIFRRHKVRRVTDGPMVEMLKISGTKGRLAKLVAELRTYNVSYILRKDVEGQVVRKFLTGRGCLLHQIRTVKERPRSFIRASHNTKGVAGLLGQVIRTRKDRSDVDQMEGKQSPKNIEAKKKKRRESYIATTSFHRFWITYLPKVLNIKAEELTGLASIKLELLNQEVSIGIKTRPSVEVKGKRPEESMIGKVNII